jgi:acetoin utilization deacetylase AcuC-like enzyme
VEDLNTEADDELLLFTDERMLAHAPTGEHPEHPENPGRLEAILDRLRARPRPGVSWRAPPPAPREALLRVHSQAHVDRLEALRGQERWISADTGVCAGSVDAAYLAAGAGIAAIDALATGAANRAFCLVRPPGHHAKRERMMGFCFVNNVAVAAAHARQVHGAERVMIVDWDVHHGNGTEAIFFADPRVLVVDSHQTPLFPGTGEMDSLGEGAAFGRTVNLPVPAGTGDGDLLAIYRALLPALAASFEPELILVSAGFDGHRDDPIGGLELTEGGFANLCALVRDLANLHCGGKLVLLLEGGYDHAATAASVDACVDVLVGGAPPDAPPPGPLSESLLPIFRAHHGLYWPGLRSGARG